MMECEHRLNSRVKAERERVWNETYLNNKRVCIKKMRDRSAILKQSFKLFTFFTSGCFKWRKENDKYKQWDGRVGENYLPETLACCQLRDIHLCCRAQLMRKTREETERERERRVCMSWSGALVGQWQWCRNILKLKTCECSRWCEVRPGVPPTHGSQIPLHGLLQIKTDLEFAIKGAFFFFACFY